MRYGLKALTLAALLVGSTAANAGLVKLTFNEVDFGTSGGLVDPLPSDAYVSYGILMSGFYWGTAGRDPFGDEQRVVSGRFPETPTINFLRATPFVQFQYWMISTDWQIDVRAYDESNTEVGAFIGGELWSTGGGEARIVGPHIVRITVSCREAVTGITYGAGCLGFSTLRFVGAP